MGASHARLLNPLILLKFGGDVDPAARRCTVGAIRAGVLSVDDIRKGRATNVYVAANGI